ncbi:hypothetical protein BAE30_04195 [Acidithiobacillus caldus]|uniref:Uncharacterized protein n=1 Tax=Acidithiobacillus caldus TaxID=33059 RepID=A0A1E7YYZ3_9PROT|nr:hypothetical protein BAE30_04195 [Acidithiobacillus caldus]
MSQSVELKTLEWCIDGQIGWLHHNFKAGMEITSGESKEGAYICAVSDLIIEGFRNHYDINCQIPLNRKPTDAERGGIYLRNMSKLRDLMKHLVVLGIPKEPPASNREDHDSWLIWMDRQWYIIDGAYHFMRYCSCGDPEPYFFSD